MYLSTSEMLSDGYKSRPLLRERDESVLCIQSSSDRAATTERTVARLRNIDWSVDESDLCVTACGFSALS